METILAASLAMIALGWGEPSSGQARSGPTGVGLRNVGTASIDDGRYGLLDGASTRVPKEFNPALGEFKSEVTAVRFHSDAVIGTNRDGSPRYVPSYEPGGLVPKPVGIPKTINGVELMEYGGEISGYVNRSKNDRTTEILYGPIDEEGVDHAADADSERSGLKGISFILRVPKDPRKWNGALVDFHTGGWPNSSAIYDNGLDEIYLVSRGFAHAGSFASGYDSSTETNRNNDEYWENVARNGPSADTCRFRSTKRQTNCAIEIMYTRDFAAVMKNLVKRALGRAPEHTYYSARSLAGEAALPLDAGRRGSANDMRYFGNNYVEPFSNCRYYPNGGLNPRYQPDSPMVFDGFLVHSPSHQYMRAKLDWRVPISPAPMIVMTGETDHPATHFGGLLLPYWAHMAREEYAAHVHEGPNLPNPWPDTSKTFFHYSFEHFPHFPQLTTFYALAKNGGEMYAYLDPRTAKMTFNRDGIGKRLDRNLARVIESCDYLGIPIAGPLLAGITCRGYSLDPLGGVAHRMIENLHEYVTTGKMPPVSNIDPYSFVKDEYGNYVNNTYPKFPAWVPGSDYHGDVLDTTTIAPGFGRSYTIDVTSNTGAGPSYRQVLEYIDEHGQDVLRFERTTWRTPGDAARIGVFKTWGPFSEYVYQPFTDAELTNGYDLLDWNGDQLVTMTLRSGRDIPQGGYVDHAGYTQAVREAVEGLVAAGRYHEELGALLVADAESSTYPEIVSEAVTGTTIQCPQQPVP